ncbi:MAG TPA: peptidyl-alpha-hydroxyglycine alpha-amidating lyase family protein [Pirellulales bacterium]|jgi:DNA-binding beta-propeller fold protein YncE|nr:peptidyl-alpha-hydroxyglycine alpha-amidating lyase family protein [Pirellulales bacterium]
MGRESESTDGDALRRAGYEPVPGWPELPAGLRWQEVAAVACDSRDRVYVFNRGEHPVLVFEADGSFFASWGEGVFARPHGIFIGPDDAVYCTDDAGHTIRKFTPDGRLLLTLGDGRPSDTGATSVDYRTIRGAAGPFHYPTNLALAADGAMYVADGYGNARIHKFSPEGRLAFSWGSPGDGPGQFHVPHGIAVARDGTVYVADRENSRIQLFDGAGAYLGQWTDVVRPCQIFIDKHDRFHVAELGWRAGMWPGTSAPSPDAAGGRVSIFDREGRLLARWGGGKNPCETGDFYAPHGVWCDSQGSIYVAEVVYSAGGKLGLVPGDCHSLQKFTKKPRSG